MTGSAASAWALILLLQGAVSGWVPTDPGAAAQDRHLGPRCADCHLAGSEVTLENARRLTASQERICGTCHEGEVGAGHPMGFAPERPLPTEFPLDWKGEVTCSTCHAVHEAASGRLRALSDGRDFCHSCHQVEFFESVPGAGLPRVTSAHLDAWSGPISSTDPYSMECIQCHQDKLSLQGDGIRGSASGFNATSMVNHPIGSEYRWAARNSGLHPEATLPKDVLLPGGKVSCVSCHRPYSQRHGALVAQEPDLCFHCHDK